jgi:hypothetical protein
MKYAFFWGVTQHRVVIFTDVSGQRIGPIFKGQEVQEEYSAWTSVNDYHSTLRYTAEERRSKQHRGGSLKSQK